MLKRSPKTKHLTRTDLIVIQHKRLGATPLLHAHGENHYQHLIPPNGNHYRGYQELGYSNYQPGYYASPPHSYRHANIGWNQYYSPPRQYYSNNNHR